MVTYNGDEIVARVMVGNSAEYVTTETCFKRENYWGIGGMDDAGKFYHLGRYAIRAQANVKETNSRMPFEFYAIERGYNSKGEIWGESELGHMVKTAKSINKAMAKIESERGYTDDYAETVFRVLSAIGIKHVELQFPRNDMRVVKTSDFLNAFRIACNALREQIK